MNASERITRMKNTLAAAEAIQAEIERRNEGDTNPLRVEQREPLLQRAIIEVRDTRRKIRDLEAALVDVALDDAAVARLDRQAAKLDDAIRANALVDLAMGSLTTVLNSVKDVRATLA